MQHAGCFAIECHRCRSFFCGWCLEKCGSSADVHSHITICSKKLNTRDYHGTFLEFKKAHAGRRQAELVKYLNKNVRDKKVKEKVRKRVEFALSDY
jgi:formate hydrogenlyase subunit 6/NADH:ubiquinone oxidoreductase subunit I